MARFKEEKLKEKLEKMTTMAKVTIPVVLDPPKELA